MVIGDGVLTPAISGVTSFMIKGEPRLKHDRAFLPSFTFTLHFTDALSECIPRLIRINV